MKNKFKNSFYLIFFIFSCSSTNNKFTSKEISKIFNASYNMVWEASIKELESYKFKITDYDTGTIITEKILTYEKLNSFQNTYISIESHFYINISTVSTNPYKTKVAITKYANLINSNTIIGTDYLDEKILLYRIKRSLELKRKKIGNY